MTIIDSPPTVDEPWPVALLATKIKGWIDRLGSAWVEGEITQWGSSGGNVYGKLKDLHDDATVGFAVWSSVRARRLVSNIPFGDNFNARGVGPCKLGLAKTRSSVSLGAGISSAITGAPTNTANPINHARITRPVLP